MTDYYSHFKLSGLVEDTVFFLRDLWRGDLSMLIKLRLIEGHYNIMTFQFILFLLKVTLISFFNKVATAKNNFSFFWQEYAK